MATRTDVTKVHRTELGAEPVARTPLRRRAPIVALIFLATVAVGGALASAGPSAEELEQAHWQAVVDHYSGLYQATADAAASEALHWQQVVEYYESQWVPR